MKNVIKKRGFTLIELLATISILSIVVFIVVYIAISVIDDAKDKGYEVTVVNIENIAKDYLYENSSKLFYVHSDENEDKYEYQCVSIQSLIDFGYFKSDILDAEVEKNRKVDIDDYVYLLRDRDNKTLIKSIYTYGTDYELKCKQALEAFGDIVIYISPGGWSQFKNVDVYYQIKNTLSKSDYNYQYEYVLDGENRTGYINSENSKKNLTINQNGKLYTRIVNKDDESKVIYERELKISDIDTVSPVIRLGNYNGNRYVRNGVTIPLVVTENLSGIGDSELTKENLNITVGGIECDSFNVEKKNDKEYNLVIDNSKLSGNIEIVINSNVILDKAGNANIVTKLEPSVIFDNIAPTKPIITNSSNEEWVSGKINLTLETSENGSGVNYWQYSYLENANAEGKDANKAWVKYNNSNKLEYVPQSFTEENNRLIYVRACDVAGNCSQVSSTYIKIDKTIPTVSISAKEKSSGSAIDSGNWAKEGLNFTLTQGTVGLSGATIYYCKDTNNKCNPTTKATSGTAITSYNTTDGTYYIRYKITSGSGISSSIDSYTAKVDTTTPIVTISAKEKSSGSTVGSGNWAKEGLNFTLTQGTVGLSGATIYYCKDTDNKCNPTTKATSGTAITNYNTVTGTYYIRYKITSGSGTSSSIASYTAKVDTTTPIVTISAKEKSSGSTVGSGSWTNEGLNFTLTQGTVGSSGATIYYCKDTNNKCNPTTKVTSGTSIKSYNGVAGTYYIRYKITGGSGLSSSVGSYTSKVDMTPPTYESGGYISYESVYKPIYSDGDSGVKEIKYYFSSSSIAPSKTNENFKTFDANSTYANVNMSCGTYYAWVIAIDYAGNVSDVTNINSYYDSSCDYVYTPPSCGCYCSAATIDACMAYNHGDWWNNVGDTTTQNGLNATNKELAEYANKYFGTNYKYNNNGSWYQNGELVPWD